MGWISKPAICHFDLKGKASLADAQKAPRLFNTASGDRYLEKRINGIAAGKIQRTCTSRVVSDDSWQFLLNPVDLQRNIEPPVGRY